MIKVPILLLLFAQLLPFDVRAQEIGGIQVTAAEHKACGPDAMRLCRGMMPDMLALFGCMKQKRAQLSSACDQVARARGL